MMVNVEIPPTHPFLAVQAPQRWMHAPLRLRRGPESFHRIEQRSPVAVELDWRSSARILRDFRSRLNVVWPLHRRPQHEPLQNRKRYGPPGARDLSLPDHGPEAICQVAQHLVAGHSPPPSRRSVCERPDPRAERRSATRGIQCLQLGHRHVNARKPTRSGLIFLESFPKRSS